MSASSNKFGSLFQWTSFGESHGPAMGVVIDGCPAGVDFDEALLRSHLEKRRPGSMVGPAVSERKEADQAEVLSGVFEGKTLGTPIALVVRNQNQKSKDYEAVKEAPRVGHADDLWKNKFGHWDFRGGARASARETINWVMAGSVAQMFCRSQNLSTVITAKLQSVGSLEVNQLNDPKLVKLLEDGKERGESFGATVKVSIDNPPPFLGEPVFKKLKSDLAQAFMMINACSGVELGDGFLMAHQKGSEVHTDKDSPAYGGIRGGISTGEKIEFRLAYKPTSSIGELAKQGRHDPCVAIRSLPIVEAMAWNVLADHILMKRLNQI